MVQNDEQVLVIRRALFDSLGAFQGVCPEPAPYLGALLDPRNNFFLDRALAEDDPGHKQIIPYCVFHHRGRVLRYTRGKAGGEKRLASLRSIGIGGHVNHEDAGGEHLGAATYFEGVAREIREEVRFSGTFIQRVVGLLNDDSNPVGQVHLGIVHWVDLEAGDPDLRPNEAPITDAAFLTPAELAAEAGALETWSRLCLPHLEAWMAGSAAPAAGDPSGLSLP